MEGKKKRERKATNLEAIHERDASNVPKIEHKTVLLVKHVPSPDNVVLAFDRGVGCDVACWLVSLCPKLASCSALCFRKLTVEPVREHHRGQARAHGARLLVLLEAAREGLCVCKRRG